MKTDTTHLLHKPCQVSYPLGSPATNSNAVLNSRLADFPGFRLNGASGGLTAWCWASDTSAAFRSVTPSRSLMSESRQGACTPLQVSFCCPVRRPLPTAGGGAVERARVAPPGVDSLWTCITRANTRRHQRSDIALPAPRHAMHWPRLTGGHICSRAPPL